jgi:hypothetical protein
MVTLKQKNIIVNSSILFIVTSTLAMTLHEFGHFFASMLVNAKEISIHHNFVSNNEEGLSLQKILFIKGAGPLVSLMIGVIFHFIVSRQAKRNILFLFNLYMSSFGYIGFFGYLMIAPMFTGGDTGYICYALGFPIWLTIIIALSGATILYFLMNVLAKYFVEMGSKEIIENKESRKLFIQSLILYPIFIGIIVTSALNLPIKVVLSLIAPICSPFSFFWGYKNALVKVYPYDNANIKFESLNRIQFWLFLILFATIVMNRLLVNGIYVS